MIPDEIVLSRYRSFEGRQPIALKPLTLLYGRNNAGKSTLLRALPLLSESIATQGADVLSLVSPAVRGASFRDLSFDQRPEGFSVEWWWKSLGRRVIADYQWFPDWARAVIRRYEILEDTDGTSSSARSTFSMSWVPRRDERESAKLTYQVEVGGVDVGVASVAFQGPVPRVEGPIAANPELIAATEALRSFGGEVQWIEAARRRPERSQREPLGPRWRLESHAGTPRCRCARCLRSNERSPPGSRRARDVASPAATRGPVRSSWQQSPCRGSGDHTPSRTSGKG